MLLQRVSWVLFPLLAACGTVGAQESVLWSSDANAVNQTSTGGLMDAGFKFEIGVFKGSFVPTSGNTASWAANWSPAARTAYLTTTKRFADTVVASSNAAPFTFGKTAYVWGFRGSPSAGEWILFRASSWTWPDANGFMFHEWFAKDATPVLGQIHASGSPFLMKSAAVSNVAPPSTSWDQWRLEKLEGETLNAPDQDPDHDGSPNLLEFVFGLNPAVPEAPVTTPVSLVSGHLTISIPRRIDHTATLLVEVSSDLTNWQSGAAHTQTMTETPSLLVVRDLTPLDNSHPKRFIRLRASLP